jgi:hypothetical protein
LTERGQREKKIMRSDPFPKASARGGDVEPSVAPASLNQELAFPAILFALLAFLVPVTILLAFILFL